MCYLHIRADLSLIYIIYDDVRILKLGGLATEFNRMQNLSVIRIVDILVRALKYISWLDMV